MHSIVFHGSFLLLSKMQLILENYGHFFCSLICNGPVELLVAYSLC